MHGLKQLNLNSNPLLTSEAVFLIMITRQPCDGPSILSGGVKIPIVVMLREARELSAGRIGHQAQTWNLLCTSPT